jgi:hypothetical protein
MTPHLPVLKPREVVRILERLDFVEVRQRGSHKQFRHADGSHHNRSVSRPRYLTAAVAADLQRHWPQARRICCCLVVAALSEPWLRTLLYN